MSRFVLTAQLQLQAPTNVAQVVRQIQNQLNNVNVNVQVQGAAQAQRQLQQVTAQTQAATTAAARMGRAFAVSVRRFAAFSIATRAVGLFTSTLADAVQSAIDFEREMIRVSQVTGETIANLKAFSKTVSGLSTSLGVASSDLLQAGQLLLQAGISAKDTEVALKTLAKAALAPNFDSLSETTEGAIAILAQFGEGVGALEKQLGSINAVAGAFAVEAGDLIDVIRRAGGVFKASGGDLNELIALFTSVRATTRESAESIGTGLRTIFTRIQRPKTIEFLKQFGVELVDIEGKFVGPYEAVRRLSGALAGLGERDITFIKIAEELGGFRQIGKVLPLLQQFSVAQNALNVANKAGNSLTSDAATAQQALAIRITKVKEEFLALIRSVTETKTFQIMANTALSLASALIKIADSIKPLLPLLAAVAAVNFTKGIGSFIGNFGRGLQSQRTFAKGGKVHYFARGGMVPGSGNRDTVPAMLQPGEFVIRKSSVSKLGASNLAAMNNNRFQGGIKVTKAMQSGMSTKDVISASRASVTTPRFARESSIGIATTSYLPSPSTGSISVNRNDILNQVPGGVGVSLAKKFGTKEAQNALNTLFKGKNTFKYNSIIEGIGKDEESKFATIINESIGSAIDTSANRFATEVMGTSTPKKITKLPSFYSTIDQGFRGQLFESTISALAGKPLSGQDSRRPIDFTRGIGKFKSIYSNLGMDYVDAKITSGAAGLGKTGELTSAGTQGLAGKVAQQLSLESLPFISNLIPKKTEEQRQKELTKKALSGKKFATGGNVGTDTVPALLTPGEFVVNRSSAQRIGYGNLNRMNKVGRYAKGGIVHRFNQGGTAPVMSGSGNLIPFDTLSRQARNLANVQQSLQAATQASTQATQQSVQPQQQQNRSITDVIKQNNLFRASIIATVPSIIQGFLPAIDENSSALLKLTHGFLGLVTTITSVGLALQAFGLSLNAKQIMQLFGSGPGSIGGLFKTAFQGISKSGNLRQIVQAGPLAKAAYRTGASVGDISSRTGSIFSNARSGLNNFFAPVNRVGRSAASGFSQGMRGMPGAQAYFGRGASPFMRNLSIGATKTGGVIGRLTGSVANPIGKSFSNLRAGIGVGMNQGLGATQLVRNIAGAGGTFGRVGQGIGALTKIPGVGAIGRLAAGAAGGIGGMAGGLGGFASAAAGPIAGVTAVVGILNSLVGSFRDLDGQVQKSIASGKVEEASKLAVAKAAADFPLIGNLVGGWNDTIDSFLIGLSQAFGGPSLDSIKALAASQAGAVKTQKQLEQAQKTATQAMQDFENGSISASDALSKIRAASTEVAQQEKRASDFALKNTENMASGGLTGRNIASFLTLGMVESSSQRNQRLGQQSAEQINQAAKFEAERFQMETGARTATIRSGFARGRSAKEIRAEATGDLQSRLSEQKILGATLQEKGDEAGAKAAFAAAEQLQEQIKQVDREMANLEKEVARAKAAFDAMNLGLRSAAATASAMSASMDLFTAGLEVGGNMFVANTEFLSQAVTSAAQAMNPDDIKKAVSDVSSNLSAMGVSPQAISKFEGNTNAMVQAQQNYTKAFDNIKKGMAEKDFQNLSSEDLKKAFAKELTVGLGDDAKKNLTAIIEGMELSDTEVDAILGGNLEIFGEKLGEAGKKQIEQIMKIAQERQKAEQAVIQLTQQRIEAERNLVNAQREAVDLYMEGRDIQAKYGGQAVTGTEKRGAILAKANAGAARSGLAQMTTGSVAELRARNNQILTGFGAIEARRSVQGGMQGKTGVELDAKQKDLQQAQKDQIQTIRDLIKLEEEELKIIQEKNKLEKDSLESLISGDIEKFFEQQAAVGAQAAIASGDTNAANIFGAKAVATAFQDIQRMQEAGVQSLYGRQLGGAGGLAEQAAQAALGARGVTDPRMAQRLAGTSPEEEAVKSRLRELGGVLGETGMAGAAMAEMQVQTAQINVANAELKLSEIEERGRAAANAMSRGGVVYANRGIFVPRGTDTVPAMLTPGEFVVRREAVNRGNNLQLLRAINSGGGAPSGFARGGKVGYYNAGGMVQYKAGGDLVQNVGIDNNLINRLENVFKTFVGGFNDSIKNLQNTKLQVKMDSVNVNVNFTGSSTLTQISSEARNSIINEVVDKLKSQYSVNSNGKMAENPSTLPKISSG